MTLQLKDPSLLETRGFVGGAWRTAEKTFAVRNPATGALIAEVADLSEYFNKLLHTVEDY